MYRNVTEKVKVILPDPDFKVCRCYRSRALIGDGARAQVSGLAISLWFISTVVPNVGVWIPQLDLKHKLEVRRMWFGLK